MRLLGQIKLKATQECGSDIGLWIAIWIGELSFANWKETNDVLEAYPRVEQKGANVFVFPVSDSSHRIKILLSFEKGTALIQEVYKNE
ncbi:type II toxin-antitoxin system HigB family toxin [Shewanella algae]|uniref:type II toxin-antitoxin system HigB family toxin n=1 Tax=Shewanella algae TaxID=38313 RepID=UPI002231364C|nr:type II toxin-antitoxin system HigB family toxin [Shewanella algae]UZD58835.1 type II toxin-antitoxin system HigB family toxin [Shewanella algae]